MENITGPPVTYKNYLHTRLFLVDELRKMVKDYSVIIESPRRFGKTSVIKEFIRQEDESFKKQCQFNILLFELEGETNIDGFCRKLIQEILKLYQVRKKFDDLKTHLGGTWDAFITTFKKVKFPGIEVELREKTNDYDFPKWKEKITPLITNLNSFKQNTVIVFDEFPDMLINFKKDKKIDYKDTLDSLLAWLRSLRQQQNSHCKFQFVFCGSIHLRNTLEAVGLGKRINDLETLNIPPIKEIDEARTLLESLKQQYHLEIETEGLDYMVSKITSGPIYYGQILFKALRESRKEKFSFNDVKTIYSTMLSGGNHDFNHYHSRLEDYLSHVEKRCSEEILKQLCYSAILERELYDTHLPGQCNYEEFQGVVNRLIYEGYIIRDIENQGKIRFMAPMLRDWWRCKKGLNDVCI